MWSVICVSQPQQVISVPTGTPLCKITTKRLVNSFHSNRWATTTTLYIFPVSIILLCRLQHCFFRENNTRDFQKIYNFWIHHLGSISKKIFAVLMEWGCKLYTEITYEGNLIPFFYDNWCSLDVFLNWQKLSYQLMGVASFPGFLWLRVVVERVHTYSIFGYPET